MHFIWCVVQKFSRTMGESGLGIIYSCEVSVFGKLRSCRSHDRLPFLNVHFGKRLKIINLHRPRHRNISRQTHTFSSRSVDL